MNDLIEAIRKPSSNVEWLTSDHVTEFCEQLKAERAFELTSWIASHNGSTP